jgi:hypothetical protein
MFANCRERERERESRADGHFRDISGSAMIVFGCSFDVK